MTPTEIRKLLVSAFTHNLRVLIAGEPGVGKTATVQDAAEEVNMDMIVEHGSISEPTDMKGLPGLVNGKAEFLPYGGLRRIIEAKKPLIVMLDDLGQTPVSVQAGMMQMIHGNRVNGYHIPEHVRFVGATNDPKHMAGVVGIIEPVKSRWHTIVKMETSSKDWDEWAQASGMPPVLRAYIQANPNRLCDFKPTRELTNSPSPRNWESVGRWINAGITDTETISGAIGQGDAAMFAQYMVMVEKLPPITSILADPKGSVVPVEPSLRYAVSLGLAHVVTSKTMGAALEYCKRLPKAFEHLFVTDAHRRNPKVIECREFQAWLTHKDNAEIVLG